jgi:hypothetical protein
MRDQLFRLASFTVLLTAPFSFAHANQRPGLSASANALCECRANGRIWVLGDKICLNGRMAVCSMNQNVTNWAMTPDSCPEAAGFENI